MSGDFENGLGFLVYDIEKIEVDNFLWTFSVLKFRHYGAMDGDDTDDDGEDDGDGEDGEDDGDDDGEDSDGGDGSDGDNDIEDGDDGGGDGDVRHLRSPDLRIISCHHHCCQSLCQRHEG